MSQSIISKLENQIYFFKYQGFTHHFTKINVLYKILFGFFLKAQIHSNSNQLILAFYHKMTTSIHNDICNNTFERCVPGSILTHLTHLALNVPRQILKKSFEDELYNIPKVPIIQSTFSSIFTFFSVPRVQLLADKFPMFLEITSL